jgi:hypothetical protein
MEDLSHRTWRLPEIGSIETRPQVEAILSLLEDAGKWLRASGKKRAHSRDCFKPAND